MTSATVNGVHIAYHHGGTGPRLLFLNGSGATLAGTGLLLAPFEDHFELLAHDQRGLGESAVPPGPYSMADYASDALALLDHAGWDRCRVIGVSFGGMVAQELAVTAPERVERLALLCTSPGGAGGSSYPLHELASLSAEQRALVAPLLLDRRFTPEWLAANDEARGLVEFMAARTEQERSAEVQRGEELQLQARWQHDVTDRLSEISCPTLVAAGRFDGIAPVANSEAIIERIGGAELRLYDGGHAFFVQDPHALREVIAFLAVP